MLLPRTLKWQEKDFLRHKKHSEQEGKEQYNSQKKLDTRDLADWRRFTPKSAFHFYTSLIEVFDSLDYALVQLLKYIFKECINMFFVKNIVNIVLMLKNSKVLMLKNIVNPFTRRILFCCYCLLCDWPLYGRLCGTELWVLYIPWSSNTMCWMGPSNNLQMHPVRTTFFWNLCSQKLCVESGERNLAPSLVMSTMKFHAHHNHRQIFRL